MPIKQLAYTFTIFIVSVASAEAQLSYNPWTEPNDAQTISKYYERLRQQQEEENIEYYEPEAPTELDRSSAYLELPSSSDETDDDGFLSRVGDMFKTKKEPVLIPNTEKNRRIINEMKEEKSSGNSNSLLDSGNEMLDSIGFNKLKKSIGRKIPRISTEGMINRFERASGVNFKSIARKMKR